MSLPNEGLAARAASRDTSGRSPAPIGQVVPDRAKGYRPRPPRYRLKLPAVVQSATSATFMNTFSVSLGGCGLSWIGARPRLGNVIYVRLGGGRSAANLRGMVCWVRDASGGVRVGIRFVGGEESKFAAILPVLRAGSIEE